jgi:phosphatidylinositol alpha-1,6-mannosyltransferase
MAAARPVVVTDVGGAREAVTDGETGYIVPSGNDRAMAERIISLLNDPQAAQQMGLKGQRVVRENFSCDAQLNNTIELYDQLLGELQFRDASRTRKAASREATVIER